jgi:hypothetical protein
VLIFGKLEYRGWPYVLQEKLLLFGLFISLSCTACFRFELNMV